MREGRKKRRGENVKGRNGGRSGSIRMAIENIGVAGVAGGNPRDLVVIDLIRVPGVVVGVGTGITARREVEVLLLEMTRRRFENLKWMLMVYDSWFWDEGGREGAYGI